MSHRIGAERWLTIHDDLLRGLAHAISNRLATVMAAAGILEAGITPDPRFATGLRSDAEQLEGLLHLMRQLPRQPLSALEPLLITDAVETARRLVGEHPGVRGRDIVVQLDGDVQPVRAEPGAVVHAAAVAMLAAARLGGGAVRVVLRTAGDVVQCSARSTPAAEHDGVELALDHQVIDWLLAHSNGRANPQADACSFELPTLQSSRRRPV